MKRTLRFSVLASGSRGNACYFETDEARVLVDAGLSCRELEHRLTQVGARAGDLDALVITHEHSDHIRGAGPLTRRYNIPAYLNRATLEQGRKTFGTLPNPVIIHTGHTITINDLTVETFTKCHDAGDPLGLVVSCDGARIGVATDLGRTTNLVEDRLRGCRALVLEFNHDPAMLDEGPYPLFLKRRIKGADGHLSNGQAGELLQALAHDGLEIVVLAHLSETNNHPDKAYREAERMLSECGCADASIHVGEQDRAGPMIELGLDSGKGGPP